MALVVEAGARRAALLVDDVLDEQEVIVQALPAHLRRRAVRGATVTPHGQMLLLLDVQEVVSGARPQYARGRPAASPVPAPSPEASLAPRVLVVDDSVTIRRSLGASLSRAGFEVLLARDGIEALDTMLLSPPRVVILDVEMPRLDGFELLSILRSSPQLAGVRVVMLTSRAANKHRQHAFNLGAQAYLIKPCPQETLIETVRGLLVESVIVR
jgi:chemosensory pili system protein ChpA (sensor histidine kinase/response regulator)